MLNINKWKFIFTKLTDLFVNIAAGSVIITVFDLSPYSIVVSCLCIIIAFIVMFLTAYINDLDT